MSLTRQIALTLILLIAVMVLFEISTLDIWVQNHFYDASATGKPPLSHWLIDKTDHQTEFWLHEIPEKLAVVAGVSIFLLFLVSFRLKKLSGYRKQLLLMVCCVGLVPLLVGGGKHFTNTYCPNQTTLYGGDKPYAKVLEHYPAGFNPAKPGKCFPAAHATIGFSLMGLYFVFRFKHARRMGLAAGLGLGWFLGFFQMLRGEHFLSHTIISMLASWLVILLIHAAFERFYPKRNN